MEIAGRVAIVTGGGGGIGAAIAGALVDRGAKVVVTDIAATAARGVADMLNRRVAGSAAALAGDASSVEHIETAIELAEQRFGPVALYFANAGIAGGPGLEASDDQWDAALDINLLAHVRAARRLVPEWVSRGEGYFIATASAAGLLTQLGSATYSVTKHAAVGFAEWLAVTYGDCGVRVSCLCPMGVDTKLLRPDHIDDESALLMQRAVESAGDVLTPERVADDVMSGLESETFLILPHPEVLGMYRHKGSDYDRWLRGMRRVQQGLTSPDDD
ncbi:SDR family oxidoreductase [Gordonia sp. PP30]|uniref:SDR family oxidoreductase n=1 Tax=unclassified Gordonia (in: high G+C Gram-positive bacteria) TaxID=2657482 RepID=UPI00200026CF|nr:MULTISPECIES: SDR family oxidoreductase [unclassified Gordonia (in: high G+C Gram-positive bacteria)]UQE77143.1 SDR family oxidoreductase [Gordonia sp. PP30]